MADVDSAMTDEIARDDTWADIVVRLRAYLRRRVQPRFVDDLLGALMLRLIEHEEQFREADNPSAWVYRVASNAVTDHYRRNATEKRSLTQLLRFTEAGDPIVVADPAPPSASDDSALTELTECIQPLLETLPETYAQAVRLTDLGELTQRDASRELGLSHSGVKSRVQRGRVQLKQAIERCCAVERDASGQVTDVVPHDGRRRCNGEGAS